METDRLVVPLGTATGPDLVTGKVTGAAVAVEETVALAETKVEHLASTDLSFEVGEVDLVVEVEAFLAVPQVPLQSRLLHFYNSCFFLGLEKIKHWISFWIYQILSETEKASCVTFLLICFTVLITDELRRLHNVSHVWYHALRLFL